MVDDSSVCGFCRTEELDELEDFDGSDKNVLSDKFPAKFSLEKSYFGRDFWIFFSLVCVSSEDDIEDVSEKFMV